MALYGYAGKILRLDLTTRKRPPSTPSGTARGGAVTASGSALFWEFCRDKTITDGRDPANVCCVMTSPVYGTIVPSADGRGEVVGVGVGRTVAGSPARAWRPFPTMLKYAGWDAIVDRGRGGQAGVGGHPQRLGGHPRRRRALGQGHLGHATRDLEADRHRDRHAHRLGRPGRPQGRAEARIGRRRAYDAETGDRRHRPGRREPTATAR